MLSPGRKASRVPGTVHAEEPTGCLDISVSFFFFFILFFFFFSFLTGIPAGEDNPAHLSQRNADLFPFKKTSLKPGISL